MADPLSNGAMGSGIGPGMGQQEQQTFGIVHRHSGSVGDGQRIQGQSIDFTFAAIVSNQGPILTDDAGSTKTARLGVRFDDAGLPILTLTRLT